MKMWKQILSVAVGCLCFGNASSFGAAAAPALVKTQEISVAQKAKAVSLQGKVENWRPSSKDNVPNSFTLRDDAGTVRVCLWKAEFDKVVGKDKLANGVMVKVVGEINDFKGTAEVHVKSDGSLVVVGAEETAPTAKVADTKAKPAAAVAGDVTKTGSVSLEMVDKTVTVQGALTQVKASTKENTPWMLKMDDGSGAVDIVFWVKTADELTAKPVVGETWRTSGKVSDFKGKVQLRAEDAKAWTKAAADEKAAIAVADGKTVPTGTVTASLSGKTVTVQGEMLGLTVPKTETAPYVMKVDDGTGVVDVVFWKQTVTALTPEQKAEPGQTVLISGEVNEHRGNIQLKVESATAIKTEKSDPATVKPVEKANAAPEAPAKTITLKDLSAAEVKSRVNVKVTVKANEKLRSGQKLSVTDASNAESTLYLWDNAIGLLRDEVRRASLNLPVGAMVDTTAVVADEGNIKVLYVNKAADLHDVQLKK